MPASPYNATGYQAGYYGDYPIDLINPMLQSGQITLPDPETGEPILFITPEGRPMTAQKLGALGTATASGSNQTLTPEQIDNVLGGMENPTPYQPDRNDPAPTPEEQRFGNDMAWATDPAFQVPIVTAAADPTIRARQDALGTRISNRGTAADPSVDAAQKDLVTQILNRGLTANQGVQDSQLDLANQYGTRGVTASPEVQAQQQALVQNLATRGTTADTQSEQGLRSLAADLGGRGSAASAQDEAQQRDLLNNILSRGSAASAEDEGQQRDLLQTILGRGTTADADSEAAQRAVMNELFGLYSQGGQDAQNRAARAKSRADSENWLKGQREADQQSLAERGLSGSGSELVTLLGDRQAAASRLSSADLEADAAAEKRALDALLAGVGVAGTMRGQADQYEQGNTSAASSLASAIRNASDAYSVNNTNSARGLATDMRNASDAYQVQNDRQIADILGGLQGRADTYTDSAYRQQGDILQGLHLANDAYVNEGMRGQAGILNDVHNANDAYSNETTRQAGTVLQGIRTAGDAYDIGMTGNEIDLLAGIADDDADLSKFNAGQVTRANDSNTGFIRGQYTDRINRIDRNDQRDIDRKIEIATGLGVADTADNNSGFGITSNNGTTDAKLNTGQTNMGNTTTADAYGTGTQWVIGANGQRVLVAGNELQAGGDLAQGLVNTGTKVATGLAR